jgi:hypothetical protein
VRYPTRELLRCLQRKPPWTDFWLPDLTPEEACRLTEFLDDLQEAIWMDHGDGMVAYWQSLEFPDLHPPSDAPSMILDRRNGPQDDLPF